MGKILLEGLEFFAFHGNFPEERKIGGRYQIDLILEFIFDEAIKSDILSDTVDYGQIYKVVEEEMKMPSNLIEHVAGRIINRIIADFNHITKVSIKLSKMNPPLGAQIKAVCVFLEKERAV